MQTQRMWLFLVIFPWISLIFLPCTCSGMERPEIILESTVFVAFKGGDLTINCVLRKPVNQSDDYLNCFSPAKTEIYRHFIPGTGGSVTKDTLELNLENLKTSGEYHCQYKTVKEYWFLRVRDEGYRMPSVPNYPEFTTMAIITGFLSVFSVVGTVYVFRGHWKNINCDDFGKKLKKQKGNQENPEDEENNVDVTEAQSTSFYASLEPRPRSVYDVLDCSEANKETGKNKLKPKKKEAQNKVQPNIEPPHEGVFESVYENI